MSFKVCCVLKSGGIYDDLTYLQRLSDGIRKYLGETLYCLSDLEVPNRIPLQYGWPGWWSKMELCRPDISGGILFFDLDTIICGDLSDIASVRKFTVLQHFYRTRDRRRIGSGMMYLPQYERETLWKKWIVSPEKHFGNPRGDQDFIERVITQHDKWQDVVPGQVVSYKLHCQRGLPTNARVVCYHGKPKPHETGWATHAG